MMKESVKVGISGVRGVVGESFTPQLAASFAQAFGSLVGMGPVVVGRDTRPSGPMIEHAVVAGLQSVGCRPVLTGIIPTPSLLILTRALGARGGIAITASHNEAPWNALKFVSREGLFLDPIHAEELFDIYHQRDFPFVGEPDLRPSRIEADATRRHFEKVLDYVDAEAIRARKFKVAVDCCNGVGAVHTPGFLRDRLGCEVVSIFDEPHGRFERNPEPTPKHIVGLCDLVKAQGADIGFALDPDGDRLALVDEQGVAIGEDMSVALVAEQVLSSRGSGPVAFNLSISKKIQNKVRSLGSEVYLTPTGEIHVVKKMREVGAVVGGEHTGGVIIPAIHHCRDSYGSIALILERLAQTGKTPSELNAEYPRPAGLREKIPVSGGDAPRILRAIRRKYEGENLDFQDGVYVDLGDSWLHVRRSNTEPVIRLMAEAGDEETVQKLAAEVRGVIGDAG